jgi:hypothetical protein
MGKLKFILSVLVFFVSLATIAQNKDIQEEAAIAFDSKDYKKAYELYDKLYTQVSKNFEYKFRLGYSSLFYPEKKARAIEIFEDIICGVLQVKLTPEMDREASEFIKAHKEKIAAEDEKKRKEKAAKLK